jgi:uncharacterized membrane protein
VGCYLWGCAVMNLRRMIGSLVVVVIAFAPVSLAQAGGTYITIDFPGANSTVAEGIDTAGDIVGYFLDSGNLTHGFLLSGGIYTQLDVTGTGNGTVAFGINDVGQIVGLSPSLGLFIYDIETQTYTTYIYNGGNYSLEAGTSINNAGVVVGWARNTAFQYIGLELRNSTFKPIRIPGATSTQLTSINNSGAIIAVATNNKDVKSSYLDRGTGTFTRIVVSGVPSAYAMAINDSGVLAGNYKAPDHLSAFEWQRMGLFKPINEPQENCTYANGINSAGQVVGSYGCDIIGQQGFVWTPPAGASKE